MLLVFGLGARGCGRETPSAGGWPWWRRFAWPRRWATPCPCAAAHDLLPPMRYFRHAAIFRSFYIFTLVVLGLLAGRDS